MLSLQSQLILMIHKDKLLKMLELLQALMFSELLMSQQLQRLLMVCIKRQREKNKFLFLILEVVHLMFHSSLLKMESLKLKPQLVTLIQGERTLIINQQNIALLNSLRKKESILEITRYQSEDLEHNVKELRESSHQLIRLQLKLMLLLRTKTLTVQLLGLNLKSYA